MPAPEAPSGTAAGMAYREAGPPDGAPVVLVHGHPESSHMWAAAMSALAAAGCRAVAPDLAGYGHSPPDPPGTWERHVERLERFRSELELGRSVLVVHDWGGLIGLRWACDHPDAVRGLVISSSGFFPDGKWHGLAKVHAHARAGRGGRWRASPARASTPSCPRPARHRPRTALDEYWRAFADDAGAARSSSSTARATSRSWLRYEGKLASLGVPVLLVWGEHDEFAPVAGAHRFKRELPAAELAIVEGAGHFVWEDAPERTASVARRLRPCSPLALTESAPWSGSSTWTTPREGRPGSAGPTSRWRRGCGRCRWASSWVRSTCSAAAPRCAPRSRRAAPTR